MPDIGASSETFPTRRTFEMLLLVAALFETMHLIGLFGRRAEVDGTTLAVLFTFGVPWLVFLLGLAVTRGRSSVAKWSLIVLVAIAVLSAVRIGAVRWNEPAMALGAIAGFLQLVAVICLFTPNGKDWTRKN